MLAREIENRVRVAVGLPELPPAAADVNGDGRGPGVNAVLDKLLDHRRRSLDYLAGGDLRAAERSFQALGLRVFARVDMYVTDDGRIVVGEPNTLPGSSPSSTIFLGPIEEGIGPMALVSLIIERSLAAHQAKKGPLD